MFLVKGQGQSWKLVNIFAFSIVIIFLSTTGQQLRSFIDYDVFEVLGEDLILETKRCFKIDQRIDAVIKIFYQKGIVKQELCFLDGFGKNFENCVLIKEFYLNVTDGNNNKKVLTKDGKMKKINLILETVEPNLSNYKKIVSY